MRRFPSKVDRHEVVSIVIVTFTGAPQGGNLLAEIRVECEQIAKVVVMC